MGGEVVGHLVHDPEGVSNGGQPVEAVPAVPIFTVVSALLSAELRVLSQTTTCAPVW